MHVLALTSKRRHHVKESVLTCSPKAKQRAGVFAVVGKCSFGPDQIQAYSMPQHGAVRNINLYDSAR